MRFTDYFPRKMHICYIGATPIISRYVSFCTRDIIYECKVCGMRKIKRVYKPFGEAFPIETTPLITRQEFEQHLDKEALAKNKRQSL